MVAMAVLAAAVLMLGQPAGDRPPTMGAPRDWSATLDADARAFHGAIVDSHPGMHDPLNPAFAGEAEAGLAEALERAGRTRDAGGWWWALRAQVARYEDGHVQLGLTDQSYGFPTRWPGFLTVYRDGAHTVASRDDLDASTPPLGARLVGCDGVTAEALAERRIGAFRGRWNLAAQREQWGDWLFMDAGNPWLTSPETCRFEVEGETRDIDLAWREIAAADLSGRRRAISRGARPDFGLVALEGGGWWLSLPSFDGDPEGEAHARLTALLSEVAASREGLRAAPFVVLDLRGNGGGSSHWSGLLADALWGEAWMAARRPPSSEGVDWRASAANIAELQAFRDQLAAGGGDRDVLAWADRAIVGMEASRAANAPFWREVGGGPEAAAPAEAPASPLSGRVYVLTDAACASACLDALDLWKPLGAVQIGRETSADTLYMELRQAELPSGLARAWIPMKVYRGRARGNNEPHRPAFVFDGDMTDDAALLHWVRRLD